MSPTARSHLSVMAAHIARVSMTTVAVALRVLPRRRKITMLTREYAHAPLDFRLLEEGLRRLDPSLEVVVIARMVPAGVLRKFWYALAMLPDLYHVATSRVLVVDGYSPIASAVRHGPGLTIVQIWHALGALKRFGLSIVGQAEGREPRLARAMRMHRNYDLVLASAERCRKPFAEAFGTELSKVIVAPLPRVDRIRDRAVRDHVRARFHELHPELAGKRLLVFAPTFRTDRAQPVDVAELRVRMSEIGYVVLVKPHPLMAAAHDGMSGLAEFSTLDMILVADAFVTDYSSTVFEAAVAGVPSYLLATDITHYSAARDFYVNYPDDLGLPLARSIGELVTLISGDTDAAARSEALATTFVAEATGSPTANADAITVVLRDLVDSRHSGGEPSGDVQPEAVRMTE